MKNLRLKAHCSERGVYYYLIVVTAFYILLCHLMQKPEKLLQLPFSDMASDFFGGDSGEIAAAAVEDMQSYVQKMQNRFDVRFILDSILMDVRIIKQLLPGLPVAFMLTSIDRGVLRWVSTDGWERKVCAFIAAYILQQIVALSWQPPMTMELLWQSFLKRALMLAGGIASLGGIIWLSYQEYKQYKERKRVAESGPRKKFSFKVLLQSDEKENKAIDTAGDICLAFVFSVVYEFAFACISVLVLALGVCIVVAVLDGIWSMPSSLPIIYPLVPLLYVILMRMPASPGGRVAEWLVRLSFQQKDMELAEKWEWTTGLISVVILGACMILQLRMI